MRRARSKQDVIDRDEIHQRRLSTSQLIRPESDGVDLEEIAAFMCRSLEVDTPREVRSLLEAGLVHIKSRTQSAEVGRRHYLAPFFEKLISAPVNIPNIILYRLEEELFWQIEKYERTPKPGKRRTPIGRRAELVLNASILTYSDVAKPCRDHLMSTVLNAYHDRKERRQRVLDLSAERMLQYPMWTSFEKDLRFTAWDIIREYLDRRRSGKGHYTYFSDVIMLFQDREVWLHALSNCAVDDPLFGEIFSRGQCAFYWTHSDWWGQPLDEFATAYTEIGSNSFAEQMRLRYRSDFYKLCHSNNLLQNLTLGTQFAGHARDLS